MSMDADNHGQAARHGLLMGLLQGGQAAAAPAAAAGPSDDEILALNAGEIHFSESPSKYPWAGHGTQYHAGAPGVLSFARAVLARWGAAPATKAAPQPAVQELTDSQIMASIGRNSTGMSDSSPLGQQWEGICKLVRAVIRERVAPQPAGQQGDGEDEALRCAAWMEHIAAGGEVVEIDGLARTCAAELRRLHSIAAEAQGGKQ